jgi:hypothetical protein
MQIEPEITFEGSQSSDAARVQILSEIEKLKSHNHRITGCRVAEAKDMTQMQDPKDRKYTWPEFLAKYCMVGKGQANRLISYANGTRSKADDDEALRTRMSSKRSARADQSEHAADEPEDDEAWAVKRFVFEVDGVLDAAHSVTGISRLLAY